MTHDIAFLHTSHVHVPTFEKLLEETAPGLRANHVVREDLLTLAQRDGTAGEPLAAQVRQAMAEAGATGARVVVCTCSTIGDIAEAVDTGGAFTAVRVDRAMADQAARKGPRVLLVAALASTLRPTTALLQASAKKLGQTLQIENLVVSKAWPCFLAGDSAGYINTIVAAVKESAGRADVVVLAQASMAPAAQTLADDGITALSSPRLGVEHSVLLYRELAAGG